MLVQLRLQGIDFAVLLISFTRVFKVIGVIIIIFIVTFLVAIVVTVELIARQIPIKRRRKMNLWLLIVKTEPSDSLCITLMSFNIFF